MGGTLARTGHCEGARRVAAADCSSATVAAMNAETRTLLTESLAAFRKAWTPDAHPADVLDYADSLADDVERALELED